MADPFTLLLSYQSMTFSLTRSEKRILSVLALLIALGLVGMAIL
jgi:hypothetical protein